MAAHAHTFDAVVLAGGRSSRLGGTDKPGLVVGGQTLLGSVVSAVTSAGAARVVVVGPERPAVPGTGARDGGRLRYTREEPPGRGPVAALRCGLAEVSAPALVLAAADLPFLRPAHVARLLAALAGPAGPARQLRARPVLARPGPARWRWTRPDVRSGWSAPGPPRCCGASWTGTRAAPCAGCSPRWIRCSSLTRRPRASRPPGSTATPPGISGWRGTGPPGRQRAPAQRRPRAAAKPPGPAANRRQPGEHPG